MLPSADLWFNKGMNTPGVYFEEIPCSSYTATELYKLSEYELQLFTNAYIATELSKTDEEFDEIMLFLDPTYKAPSRIRSIT
jgi:hypothetical protein